MNRVVAKTSAPFNFDSYAKKRLSFILPTMNRAQFLPSALERCRALRGPNDELIVIDGLSADNTKEIVEKYRDIVDIFVSERDVSYSHAYNKGLLLASGRYIKIISDDEIFHSRGIEKAVDVMERHLEIDLLLTGGTKEIDGKIWPMYVPAGRNFGKSPEDQFTTSGISGIGHLIRRSSFAKYGILIPNRLACDVALILYFISRGGIVRFCRINMFHISKYERVLSYTQAEYTLDVSHLMKEYCSFPFFLKYRIKKNPILKKINAVLRHIIGSKKMRTYSGQYFQREKSINFKMKNITWDDAELS